MKRLFQMKNSKLLNKKNLSIILFFAFFGFESQSQEPVDIWNVEVKSKDEKAIIDKNFKEKNITQNTIYEMQSQKGEEINIVEDQTLASKEIEIVGLYDPAANGLDINMWINSDGEQILKLFNNINKIELSNDASEILNILLLTNAYYPETNISKEQFLELKSNWLIKKSNFELIENYLINNQIINEHPKLTKCLVNDYLARSEIKKTCEIFSKIKEQIEDEY